VESWHTNKKVVRSIHEIPALIEALSFEIKMPMDPSTRLARLPEADAKRVMCSGALFKLKDEKAIAYLVCDRERICCSCNSVRSTRLVFFARRWLVIRD
jgi:hypothetical protein